MVPTSLPQLPKPSRTPKKRQKPQFQNPIICRTNQEQIGGWGGESFVTPPTGKSCFVFVFALRACARRGARSVCIQACLCCCFSFSFFFFSSSGPWVPILQTCSEITFLRKKQFKNKGLAVFCPKNILCLKQFLTKNTFLNGFSHIFENRSKIHLKILLKEKKQRKERKKRKNNKKERKKTRK